MDKTECLHEHLKRLEARIDYLKNKYDVTINEIYTNTHYNKHSERIEKDGK